MRFSRWRWKPSIPWFGFLPSNTVQQAMDRSGESGNKGFEAAAAALEMIDVLQRI